MGWDDLKRINKASEMVNEHMEQVNADFFHLFNSELGERVLGHMRDHTIEQPTVPHQAVDGIGMAILQGIREGENNLYRWIKARIKKGKPTP